MPSIDFSGIAARPKLTRREIQARYRLRHREEILRKGRIYKKAKRDALKALRPPRPRVLKITKRVVSAEDRLRSNAAKRARYRAEPEYRAACIARSKAFASCAQRKEARRLYLKQWAVRRKATDPVFALAIILRRRIWMAFKKLKYSRKSSVRQLLGADFEVVRAHLEETFKEGMSWSNHGLWHIDHRKPLAGAADEDTLRQLFHYKNLQALWATENLSKGTRHVD